MTLLSKKSKMYYYSIVQVSIKTYLIVFFESMTNTIKYRYGINMKLFTYPILIVQLFDFISYYN